MFRDRFVTGLYEKSVQQHLLTIAEKPVKIAIAREASVTIRDTIPTFRCADPDGTNDVRKIHSRKDSNYKKVGNSNKTANTPQGAPPNKC